MGMRSRENLRPLNNLYLQNFPHLGFITVYLLSANALRTFHFSQQLDFYYKQLNQVRTLKSILYIDTDLLTSAIS